MKKIVKPMFLLHQILLQKLITSPKKKIVKPMFLLHQILLQKLITCPKELSIGKGHHRTTGR
jgi:hypothetical protein